MIVSTKGRYALRVMIDLAEHRTEKYVPLKEVAARQEISEKYLDTVGEVLTLTEGSLAPVSCLVQGAPTCQRIGSCRTYQMWKGLDDLIEDYFSHITIADLASPEEAGNDYVI